ncbi:hypothetical protein Gain_0013_008 [Komagataeibacter intermedius TF2]|uniref:Uncharacterized protein n=1 Tax=Komagataeibacter intermedius AF2 TaxID=1458464 RepID=A0A0N1N4Z9_9PROT|nr:hypothetical protein GLUCOINTEAF2_0200760 [Komagataeibacter intermedius AF2]GAN86077.1 hypothetical protein Gain_0013_008 [Komagataeibacter intermedius TF2]
MNGQDRCVQEKGHDALPPPWLDMIRYSWQNPLPVNVTGMKGAHAHAGQDPPFSRVLNVHDALLHDDPDKRRLNEAHRPHPFPQAGPA